MLKLDEILWRDILSDVNQSEVRRILSWIANLKMFSEMKSGKLDHWKDCDRWYFNSAGALVHEEDRFFEVMGVFATIGGREVNSWHQPLIRQYEHGVSALLLTQREDCLYCLVQAKSESGAFDHLELAPTVQCIVGSYKNPEKEIPFLNEILQENGCITLSKTIQSEEGGRFYREQNINIVSYTESFWQIESPYYKWVRVKDLRSLVMYNNLLNIELRTLFAIFMPI
jgi:oxidase EvaA